MTSQLENMMMISQIKSAFPGSNIIKSSYTFFSNVFSWGSIHNNKKLYWYKWESGLLN